MKTLKLGRLPRKRQRQFTPCVCCEKRCHYCGRFFDNRGYVTTYSQRGRLWRICPSCAE